MTFNRQAVEQVFLAALTVREGKIRIRGMREGSAGYWPVFTAHVNSVADLRDALEAAGVPRPNDPNDYRNDPVWILAFPEHPLDIREVRSIEEARP